MIIGLIFNSSPGTYSNSGSSRQAEKHEIYTVTFGGHHFYDLFLQGGGGPWPPRHPPWIRYCFSVNNIHEMKVFDPFGLGLSGLNQCYTLIQQMVNKPAAKPDIYIILQSKQTGSDECWPQKGSDQMPSYNYFNFCFSISQINLN